MVSLDALNEQQKDTLAQYQTITHIDDLEEGIHHLIEHDWNLERAIQSVYENNTTTTQERQVTPPLRPNRPPSLLLSILFWPFGLAWNVTWSILSFATRLMSSRPAIQQTKKDPRTLAIEFKETFEAKYGTHHIEFFKGGYSQALEKAKKDLLFFLVLLHSDDHDDTDAFCRDTLCSSRLIDFIRQKNILVWAGDVHASEAHKVSYTLQASTYPFMALIALQSNVGSSPKMTVIERMEGPSHPEELVSQIEHAMDRHGAVVHRLKNEREQREQERQLRVDQDAAYHESLKADQEKARKAQEEKEAQQEQERQKQLALEAIALQKQKREQYIQYLYGQLPDEPTEGPMAKLSFRLADGDRVIRTFKQDATVDTLYQFVQVYPFIKNNQAKDVSVKAPSDYQHQYKFTIHSPYPRMEYEPSSKPLIDIKSLWPSATLVVEEEEEEEEE